MSVVVGWSLIGGVCLIFLVGVILAVWPCARVGTPALGTRVLLVFLRLAIAWHFLVEGIDKLHNPNWTSEGYLREATGPLAPTFRALAGERLVDRLTLGENGSFPPILDREWQAYLDAVENEYGLDAQQAERAAGHLQQTKKDVELQLSIRRKQVEKYSPLPPPLQVTLTMPERLTEYGRLQEKVEEAEADLSLPYGSETLEALKTAKANAARWRAGLQRDLLSINKEMKRTLRNVLLDFAGQTLPARYREKLVQGLLKIQKEADAEVRSLLTPTQRADDLPFNWDELDRIKDKWVEKTAEVYRNAFFAHEQADPKAKAERNTLTTLVIDNILERRLKGQGVSDPLPYPVSLPRELWTHLDWSDFVVRYGIFGVGVLLLVGLFTRLACVVGAGFLLMFFLAMPPLPGWPESPRAEGHYLYINKNIIEMLALLVLATTRSGFWVGLDGVVQFLNPFRWRRGTTAVTLKGDFSGSPSAPR